MMDTRVRTGGSYLASSHSFTHGGMSAITEKIVSLTVAINWIIGSGSSNEGMNDAYSHWLWGSEEANPALSIITIAF